MAGRSVRFWEELASCDLHRGREEKSTGNIAEADDEVDSESNGGRVKENWNIVQKKGKRSKVVKSDENVTLYLVGVRFVNDEQLIE
jgi:hypothetical protein